MNILFLLGNVVAVFGLFSHNEFIFRCGQMAVICGIYGKLETLHVRSK